MDNVLLQVTKFARQAHGNQQRKFVAEPYINHLVRVMETCKQYTSSIEILSAALLHDVLEDTTMPREEIKNFLRPLLGEEKAIDTLNLVEELTDIYTKKEYPQWNRRKRKAKETERLSKTSSGAQTIKYADIIDNSSDINNAETDFARVFLFECKALLKVIPKGDSRLYKKAVETVRSCIEELNK
ncbi:MAG TPA: HD domain-containing protein [Chitinophagaceae bacterium]|nr:HD domain-containing protein [Chitinophagaceae bacterium]